MKMMHRITGRNVSSVACYVLFAFLIYFIWCDITFFSQLATERTHLLASNTTTVTKFSVKLRMLPPFDLYVYVPLCNWAENVFSLSKLPGMSPNLVTAIHFTVAVISGRMFASGALLFRRIGCFLFEFRSCLDILDGVIFRAQSKSKTFLSGWGSWGYWIDGMADVFGSLFIILGTVYRYNKSPPLKDRSKAVKYSDKVKEDSDAEAAATFLPSNHVDGVERYTRRYAFKICAFVTLSVVVRSRMWDHFTHSYHELLGVPRQDISPHKQIEILNYPSTWLIMWLWRWHCADQFLNFSLISIFFDRLWEWMRFSVKAAIPNLLIFGAICQLHVMYVKSHLQPV